MYYCLFTKTDGTKDWLSSDNFKELVNSVADREDIESREFGINISDYKRLNNKFAQLHDTLLTLQSVINNSLE